MSEIRKRKESDAKAPESAESDHVSTRLNNSYFISFQFVVDRQ